MTDKLNEMFGMAEEATKKLEETKDLVVVDSNHTADDITDQDQVILDLSEVSQHSTDMDTLATTAMDGYEAIIELAENAEPNQTARLLEVAATMMKNAIDAKNSKVKARHKAAELLLKRRVVENNEDLDDAGVVDADETVSGDRNKILDMITGKNQDKEQD